MNELERYTAERQFWLSVIFLVGYFTVLLLFMLGFGKIPPDYKEAFSGLLTLLTGGGLTILYFWFQRTRPSNSISVEPNTTMTTTSSATVTPNPGVTTDGNDPSSFGIDPSGPGGIRDR
jgi:hypothetical protein